MILSESAVVLIAQQKCSTRSLFFQYVQVGRKCYQQGDDVVDNNDDYDDMLVM